MQLQAVAAVAQVGQFVHREMLAAHFQPAFQRQQAVLEVRVERQLQGRGVVAGQVGTEQRRVEPARRLSPGQRTGQQGEGDPLLLPARQVGMMVEGRGDVALLVGQRDPQLRGVGVALVGQRLLGVGDAMTGGHQVDLAGADHLDVAQAVAVQRLALDHPGKGLQADVRVRAHGQSAARFEFGGTGMVEEAPGTDHPPLARRHQPTDGDPAADFRGTRGDPLQQVFVAFRTVPRGGQVATLFGIAHVQALR